MFRIAVLVFTFCASQAFATNECEVNGRVPVPKKSVDQVLADFSVESIFVKGGVYDYDQQRSQVMPTFNQRFAQASGGEYDLVSPFAYLQSQLSSRYNFYLLDSKKLIGQPVMMWMNPRLDLRFEKFTGEVQFRAGQIVDVKVKGRSAEHILDDTITLIVQAPDGEKHSITSIPSHGSVYLGGFFLVVPKAPLRSRVLKMFEVAKLEELVGRAFGTDVQARDYDIAWAAIDTFLSLPSTFGRTAVIKTLRGLKIDRTKDHRHYGLVKGARRYNDAALKSFIDPVVDYMEKAGLLAEQPAPPLADDASDDEWAAQAPEWIRRLKRTPEAMEFLKAWALLSAEKGTGLSGR